MSWAEAEAKSQGGCDFTPLVCRGVMLYIGWQLSSREAGEVWVSRVSRGSGCCGGAGVGVIGQELTDGFRNPWHQRVPSSGGWARPGGLAGPFDAGESWRTLPSFGCGDGAIEVAFADPPVEASWGSWWSTARLCLSGMNAPRGGFSMISTCGR